MYGDMFEEEMSRETVFKDESKLSPDYVPDSLVHRDEEFRELTRLFRPVLENEASQRVLVTGSVGVGKTTLTLKFGEELEEAANRRDLELDYVHVNCRKQNTPHMVVRKLAENYLPRLPRRGFAPQEILEDVIKQLNTHDSHLVITLDELDYFINQHGPDLLYSFTRVTEESGAPNRVSIIATSRTSNFLRLLDEATKSTFMHNKVELDRYNSRQLNDILNERAKKAFKPDTVQEDTIELVSEIASQTGDARFALELLWFSGRIANQKGMQKVTPEHARGAKAHVFPGIRKEVLRELRKHELLLLLALSRHLKISDEAYALTGELEEAYEVVCEEYEEEARKHTQIWEYLKNISNLGIINTQPSGEDHRGQSQRISIPDAPAEMLEEELEKILEQLEKS
ncbi:MAG: ORC1-type DNA replication protein [Hadesarchaea archaeon]|nr:ORC1-type DNA replication protein [Hadesarchaea archaeon]